MAFNVFARVIFLSLRALSVAGMTVRLAFFCSPGRSLHRNLHSPEPGLLFGSAVDVYLPMDVQKFFLTVGVRSWLTVQQLDLAKGSVPRAILRP